MSDTYERALKIIHESGGGTVKAFKRQMWNFPYSEMLQKGLISSFGNGHWKVSNPYCTLTDKGKAYLVTAKMMESA